MLGFVLIIVSGLFLAAPFGEPLKCYHCYESFNNTLVLRNVDGASFGQKYVPCDKNKNNWNYLNCPANMPVCVYMTGIVKDGYEIGRSCATRDFCSKYTPPSGVVVTHCRECNSTLCNDYEELPDPPVQPGPLFTFNININLNLKKYPLDADRSVK